MAYWGNFLATLPTWGLPWPWSSEHLSLGLQGDSLKELSGRGRLPYPTETAECEPRWSWPPWAVWGPEADGGP